MSAYPMPLALAGKVVQCMLQKLRREEWSVLVLTSGYAVLLIKGMTIVAWTRGWFQMLANGRVRLDSQ